MFKVIIGAPADIEKQLNDLSITNNVQFLGQSSFYRDSYPKQYMHVMLEVSDKKEKKEI